MAVGVADGDLGRLVEVLERPRGDCLDEFFSQFSARDRAKVEYYCCDMSPTFVAAKEKWCPDAKLCIDRFHVAEEVDAILAWDRELKAAYDLLQLFYAWSDMKRCADKRDGLEKWHKAAMRSGIPEFKTAARTFREHREGIPNGCKHDRTNALAEGLNSTIKLLKKTSYGIPTFARMRRRRLFTPGGGLSRDYAHLPQVDAGTTSRNRK